MKEVQTQFFRQLYEETKNRTGLDGSFYPDLVGFDLALEGIDAAGTYFVTIGAYFDDTHLYMSTGFCEKTEDGAYEYLLLADAQERFPQAYKKWMEKLDGLPRLRQSKWSRWDCLLDPEGNMLNFRDQSAQIRLLDEMDTLCGWFAEDLFRYWIQPLTQE